MTPFIKLIGELLRHGKITTVLILSPASANLFDSLLCLYPHALHLVPVYDLEPFPDANSISVLATTIKAKVQQLQLPLPIVLVADIYFTWSASLARHLAIPNILFASSSARMTAHLISDLRLANDAHGICIYTSHLLEKTSIHDVKTLVGHNRVWALAEGPLLPDRCNFLADTWVVPEAPYNILTWLEDKSPNSVVYICFGSRHNLTAPKLMVLASALEASTINFVLCAKPDDSSNLPNGFEERTSHRGVILRGWAPQYAILAHPAVGSFVTNCGWSSIMEGIAAGVPMLAWPAHPDQLSNSKLLVEDLSIARSVCQDGDQHGVPASNKQFYSIILQHHFEL